MSFEAETYRQRAREQLAEAEHSTLPNVRLRALQAAERWNVMAEQAERTSAASAKREGEKAARDADRKVGL
ncbi:MAG: hypothetical protein EOO77_22810 [Oxalobacteraceae bacterium]|nr:MAG: hypothetical protein EOO77_22810 [Oxalobacteraceae bacterium]